MWVGAGNMQRGVARRFGRYSSGWPAARVKAENISAKSHLAVYISNRPRPDQHTPEPCSKQQSSARNHFHTRHGLEH